MNKEEIIHRITELIQPYLMAQGVELVDMELTQPQRGRSTLRRVELETGRVFRHVSAGPDEYLGRVNKDGRMDRHEALSPDDYLGKITQPQSLAHAGAAFLLLVLPAESEE